MVDSCLVKMKLVARTRGVLWMSRDQSAPGEVHEGVSSAPGHLCWLSFEVEIGCFCGYARRGGGWDIINSGEFLRGRDVNIGMFGTVSNRICERSGCVDISQLAW